MKYFNYIFILLIGVLCSSCFREEIDLDLNEGNEKYVITGFISNLDEPQFIKVSKTVNYLGAIGENLVSGALVTLRDESHTYSLSEAEAGFYYLPEDWVGQVGDLHQLEVLVGGFTFSATHEMRPSPDIQNVRQRIYEELEDTDTVFIYETLFDFQEIPGEGDAYYGIDYLAGSAAGDSLINGSFTNDEFIDGQYLDDIDLSADDRLFQIGDTAVIEIYSIGKETANFLIDIESEIFRGGPFDAPPANVRTNFTGGAIGYFIIADARSARLVIE